MKKKLIFPVTVYLLFFFSCNNKEQSGLQNDAAIKAEVQQVMNKMWLAAMNANTDSVFADIDNSPDFLAMDEGLMLNYDQFKQLMKETFDSIKKQSFKKKSEEIKIYHSNLVNYLYYASDDMSLRNGSITHLSNYTGSFLLRKINGQWKIIFVHQSVPPNAPEAAQIH